MALKKKFNMEEFDFNGDITETPVTAQVSITPQDNSPAHRTATTTVSRSVEPENESVEITKTFTFIKKDKETRSIHKSFIVSPTTDRKFKAMAKNYNMSENELFNKILEQVLK